MFAKLKYINLPVAMLFAGVFASCEVDVKQTDDTRNYRVFSTGKWAVEKFDTPTATFLAEYTGYELTFSQAGSLTVLLTGAVAATGTWAGSTDFYAITINLAGVPPTLARFNGTWSVYYSTASVIRLSKTEGATQYTLWLKQV